MSARKVFVALLMFAGVRAFAAVPDWVRAAIPAQLPETNGARSLVLLDDLSVNVNADGSMNTRQRRVLRILTPAGRDDAYAAVWFDNDTKLKSLRAWSIDSAGQQYELREKDAVETSAADFELFTDTRMKVMRIPAAPGSVVAYEYERVERPYLPESTWSFQEDIPVLLARYTLIVPEGWTYDVQWVNHPPVEPSRHVWEVKSVPAIADEPRRPATFTLAGKAGFRFARPGSKPVAWADIARWYGSLAAPRTTATPALQTKVRELTAGGADALRALARFAQRDVRYVAVEIGIGGFQPHAAGDVFVNRYGDCKDKVTLLRTMLREAGVESYSVLVHTERGATQTAFPSMGAFNHVIAAVRVSPEAAKGLHAVVDHPKLGKLLLFDPTSTFTPVGELPEYLQASRGLLVTNDGGELIDLPVHAPEATQLRRVAKLALDEQGTLAGTVEEVRSGSIAATMRSTLQTLNVEGRVRVIESALAAHLANYTATDVTIEHLDDPERDLVIRYRIVAPQYAKRVADMLLIRPRVLGEKSEAVVSAKRTYAYVTSGPSLHVDEIDIRLPASWKLDELPPKVETKTAVVQYTSGSTFENGVLRYRRRYAHNAYSVAPEAIAELNRATTQILSDERASAVFK